MHTRIARFLRENQVIAGILLICVGWFLFQIQDILIGLFISYIIMAALAPLAAQFRRWHFPNGVAVGISYLLVLVCILLLIATIIPFFVTQVQLLFVNFPFYLDRAASIFGFRIDAGQLEGIITSEFNTIGQNALSVTQKLFGGFFSTITIVVVSFYLLLDRERVRNTINSLFPTAKRGEALDLLERIEDKLGAWLRGQLILSFSVGFVTWIALEAVHVQFAVPLAILAGILEVVPTLGPVMSSVPAIIVALTVSPTLALVVGLIYFFVQLIENHFLVPRIMQRAVGLNPIVVIVGIIVGGNLFGVLGALLSIPFISMCQIIISHYTKS